MKPTIIEKWKKSKYLDLDGYVSTSRNQKLARYFANQSQKDDFTQEQVLMIITMENKTGKYYISLDRDDYTCYSDEQEILL